MSKKISRITLFCILTLLLSSFAYAETIDSPDLNKVVKVSELPNPYDNPEDVGGYVLDVSEIDEELIKALPDETISQAKYRTGSFEIRSAAQ